jgi:hypothetical protein
VSDAPLPLQEGRVKIIESYVEEMRSLGPGFAAFITIVFAFLVFAFFACIAQLLIITWPIGPLVAAAALYVWWKLYRWFAKEDR